MLSGPGTTHDEVYFRSKNSVLEMERAIMGAVTLLNIKLRVTRSSPPKESRSSFPSEPWASALDLAQVVEEALSCAFPVPLARCAPITANWLRSICAIALFKP